MKLERIGNIVTGYVSPDGTNWAATDVGRIDAPFRPRSMSAWWSARRNGTLNTSTFSNVQITGGDGGAPVVIPAAPAASWPRRAMNAVPLRWQPSFGATSYTVKRATSSGGPISTVASGITASSYTDKTVTNGTTYYYVVTATNSAGTSGNSPAGQRDAGQPDGERRHGWHRNDSAEHERRQEGLRPEHGDGMVLQGHDWLAAV